MNLEQFCSVYLPYIVVLSVVVFPEFETAQPQDVGSSIETINCENEKFTEYAEDFSMKLGLCKRNISVICLSTPNHPCLKNHTAYKATAVVNGQTGQCLIEANMTDSRSIRFYVEAKRLRNPNEDGSKSLGGNTEEHQRGKCLLKYVCHKKNLYSVALDCGSVIVDQEGSLRNFTRRRAHWIAPPTFKDSVFFNATIGIAADKLLLDISTSKIFIPGIEQKESEIEKETGPIKSPKRKEKKKGEKNRKESLKSSQSKDSE